MVRFVGLDVHKRVVEACILDAGGAVVARHRFELTGDSLRAFATDPLTPDDRVVLEATTNTWAIVGALKPHVAEVVVSNPLKTRAIAEARIKTDKVDAYVLAQLLRCGFLPTVWQPDERTQQLRRLTGRRASLVGQRTAVKNRLHAVLAQRLMVPPVVQLFGVRGRAWLRSVPIDDEGRFSIDSDLRLLEAIEAQIAACDDLLARQGYADARVRLLMSIPGVNIGVAQALVAAFGDVSRFADGDRAAAYLGLVPSTRQSAEHCSHGPITKAGRGHARWMLIQAALHLRTHPGPHGVFFRRLAKKRNPSVAVVATARKLVVIAYRMLTRNEPYRYAQSRPTQHKLAQLRVEATGRQRKRGPKPGRRNVSKLGPGMRTYTIKPLAQVYQEEGLPPLTPETRGEVRTVSRAGVSDYVESLGREHVVPVKAGSGRRVIV